MRRPSKEQIRAAVQKLKDAKSGEAGGSLHVPKPQEKKGSQGRIRKKGVG